MAFPRRDREWERERERENLLLCMFYWLPAQEKVNQTREFPSDLSGRQPNQIPVTDKILQ